MADFADCGKDAAHGQVTFSIVADGVTIWTRSMNGGSADGVTNCFSIETTGVVELRFVANSNGSQNCDSAAWGDLKVCRESDESCGFGEVLPVAIACADVNVHVAGLASPQAAARFCGGTCAQMSRTLAAGCTGPLPAGLEDLAPVIELIDSDIVPVGCGSGGNAVQPSTADISRECQASLISFGSMFMQDCCVGGDCGVQTDPGVDVSVAFIPQTCTARCSHSFVPFYSECGASVWVDQPERLSAMRDLARICTSSATADSACSFLGSDVVAASVSVGPMP